MVMGTASTMACIAETLGMMLPGTAAIPAVHADRLRAAEASGAHAVAMARPAARGPREVVTQAAVDNALRVLLAIGGSTNGILHLAAIAGRAGIALAARCASTRSATRPRCWSTSSRPGRTTWRISSRPAGSAPCCASCSRCSISTRRP